MTIEQATQIMVQAAEAAPLSKAGHMQVEAALRLILEKLKEDKESK